MSDNKAMQPTITGAVLHLLLQVAAGDEGKRSASDYWVHECILRGANAVIRSRKAVKENRNRKFFSEELAKDPTILANPVKMQALARKYGIGATQSEAVTTEPAEAETVSE